MSMTEFENKAKFVQLRLLPMIQAIDPTIIGAQYGRCEDAENVDVFYRNKDRSSHVNVTGDGLWSIAKDVLEAIA